MAESVRLHGGPDAFGVPRFDFSTNSNACGPCPAALVALQSADPTRYPDPDYQSLREALAAFHQVVPERIVLAGSASEFIFRISALAARMAGAMPSWSSDSELPQRLPRPATVHLPPFRYGDYAQAARAWGLQAVTDPTAADLLWACDPSSPLGQPHECLAQQVQALRSDQMLVLDCAYRPLRLQGRLALDADGLDRVHMGADLDIEVIANQLHGDGIATLVDIDQLLLTGGDGIARVHGLSGAMAGELVRLAIVDGDRITWVAKSQGARKGLRYDPDMGTDARLSCAATGQASMEVKNSRSARCGSCSQACQVARKLRPRPKPVSSTCHWRWPCQDRGAPWGDHRPQPCKNTCRACSNPRSMP